MTVKSAAKNELKPAVIDDELAYSSKYLSRYGGFTAVFVALLLLSNILAVKVIAFGPIIVDGGVYLFPLVYICGDVLTEVYGFKATMRATVTAFALSLLASLAIFVVQISPGSDEWLNQEAFEAILGFVPRIVLASLLGFLVGQFLNAWTLQLMKNKTKEKLLRTRLIGSTVFGQLGDTLIFCTVAYFGIIEDWDFLIYTAFGVFLKIAFEVVVLPITTRVIRWAKNC